MTGNDCKQTTWGQAGCGFIILIILFLGFNSCSNRDDSPKRPLRGEDAVLLVENGGSIYVASTKDNYDRVVELATARDDIGLTNMVLDGRAALIRSGTRCRVIDPGFLTYELRILEGDYAGQSIHVASEFVHKP